MANVINVGAAQANIQSLTITPSDAQQTITPTAGIDGYAPIVVNAQQAGKELLTQSLRQNGSDSKTLSIPNNAGFTEIYAVCVRAVNSVQSQNAVDQFWYVAGTLTTAIYQGSGDSYYINNSYATLTVLSDAILCDSGLAAETFLSSLKYQIDILGV